MNVHVVCLHADSTESRFTFQSVHQAVVAAEPVGTFLMKNAKIDEEPSPNFGIEKTPMEGSRIAWWFENKKSFDTWEPLTPATRYCPDRQHGAANEKN